MVSTSKIAKSMRPTWGPPGSCRPQMGPMLAPWTLLSGSWWGHTRYNMGHDNMKYWSSYNEIHHSLENKDSWPNIPHGQYFSLSTLQPIQLHQGWKWRRGSYQQVLPLGRRDKQGSYQVSRTKTDTLITSDLAFKWTLGNLLKPEHKSARMHQAHLGPNSI